MWWRRLLFFPPLILGLAILFLVVANKPAPARKPPQEVARAARVMEVRAVPLQPRIAGYGTVRPAHAWNAIAQVGGKVIFTHPDLKKGAIIEAGTEIITIAPDDYKLAMAQAEASIRSAEAKLAELEVTERNTAALLELEREALKVSRSDYERRRKLKERGTIAPAAFEQALKAFISQRKLVQQLENTLKLIPAQRRELEEQLGIYRAQLAAAKLNVERTHIRMPFTGRVSLVAVEKDQFAPVGKQLAAADDIAVAEVEAQVPLSRMRQLVALLKEVPADVRLTPKSTRELVKDLKLHVRIVLQADGGQVTWPGRFARLSDSFDPKTRTIGIIGEVDDPYSHVTPGKRPPLTKGMFVRMEVLTRPVEAALVIPRAALRDGKVFVVGADKRLQIRKVRVVPGPDDLLVVREGLKAGERIVVSDLVPVLAGQLLKPVMDEALMKRLAATAMAGASAGKAKEQAQ